MPQENARLVRLGTVRRAVNPEAGGSPTVDGARRPRLADLRQLHHERAISSPPVVNIWFSPLLYHLLTPDELSTNLPQPCANASPHDRALATALLRAILLPIRAKTINPDVTLQLLDALGYSLDANHGILAMISGKSKPPVIAFLLFLPIQTSHLIVKSRKHQRIRAWLHSPPPRCLMGRLFVLLDCLYCAPAAAQAVQSERMPAAAPHRRQKLAAAHRLRRRRVPVSPIQRASPPALRPVLRRSCCCSSLQVIASHSSY